MTQGHRRPPSGPRVEYLASGEYQILGLPDLSPTFRTRAEGEAWLDGQLGRIGPARLPKVRPCIRCGHSFTSEGFHNRMCGACRHFSDAGSMGIAARANGQVRRAARY